MLYRVEERLIKQGESVTYHVWVANVLSYTWRENEYTRLTITRRWQHNLALTDLLFHNALLTARFMAEVVSLHQGDDDEPKLQRGWQRWLRRKPETKPPSCFYGIACFNEDQEFVWYHVTIYLRNLTLGSLYSYTIGRKREVGVEETTWKLIQELNRVNRPFGWNLNHSALEDFLSENHVGTTM